MSETLHFVQTFKKKGRALVGSPLEKCKTSDQARMRGLRASDHAAGVVVFSVTGEAEFNEFDPPVVIARYGEVPREFEA